MSKQRESTVERKSTPIQQKDKQNKRKKPGPFLQFLFALIPFVAMFFLMWLILPRLYSWGFDYSTVKGLIVPLFTGVTLLLGYFAEAKLNVCLASLFSRLTKGKKGK